MAKKDNIADLTADILDFNDRFRSYSRNAPHRKVSGKDGGDGLSDILETLYSEHRYLASLLDKLETEAARLKPRKIPDYHLLLDIIDYLTHYPDQYHHPREDLLFSTMAKRDQRFKPLLERLEREHRTLQALNHDLLNELTQIAAGSPVERPRLQRRIESYIEGYRQHMDFESREIFPQAKGSLSAAERKKLGEKTRYIDDPLFGAELEYKYRRLGRGLQARVEIAGQELVAREFSAIQTAIEKLSAVVDTAGKLKAVIDEQGRQSWREQKETIREHVQSGDGPGIASLPLALMKNNGRRWREGIGEIRQILRERDDERAGSRHEP